jgi:hypothetical protein
MTIYIFQSWNKYSPLPSPSGGAVSKSSSTSDFASPSEVDPYVKLSSEIMTQICKPEEKDICVVNKMCYGILQVLS